ncbi:cyclin-dependent kinase 5 activator 2b [Trichomycterus rosablanca]|uniref:cyclin-dependent kinase 5 activator 2b n=1 Tax=Trichomycterus rosablanca TaxID=2290929 RepID=UPI002F350A06
MGTVLSISPSLGREHRLIEEEETRIRSLSKPRVIISTFALKLVKHKNGIKVNPHPVQAQTDVKKCTDKTKNKTENLDVVPSQRLEQREPPVEKQINQTEKQQSQQVITSPVHVIVQASSCELLLCLGRFIRSRCLKITDLTANEVIAWFRNVDRSLLLQGWQEQGFITAPSLVFVYLLCRETVSKDIESPVELHGVFLTCLYLTYSYLGNEISYPLTPFIAEGNKDVFWQQALNIIDKLSSKMLRIHMDQRFFVEVFQELKSEGEVKKGGDKNH